MTIDPVALEGNLTAVRQRIAAACARCGRDAASVRLVAVTKSVDIDTVRALHALGLRDFGENRAPQGLEKIEALADGSVNWHFIGHIQRNKARKALRGFRRFHGVESERLLNILEREATALAPRPQIWIEVNVSGEENKYGIAPGELLGMLQQAQACEHLETVGLMTMAPWSADVEEVRSVFRGLRELRDTARAATGLPLNDLSMGMSNDFEIAIEEGATTVRVGSALFA